MQEQFTKIHVKPVFLNKTKEIHSPFLSHGDKESSEKKKIAVELNGDIPRNESSDSALGDSESEDTGQDVARQGNKELWRRAGVDWAEEDEIPFPGWSIIEV